jgi:nucleoside-triphosphatase THEP1
VRGPRGDRARHDSCGWAPQNSGDRAPHDRAPHDPGDRARHDSCGRAPQNSGDRAPHDRAPHDPGDRARHDSGGRAPQNSGDRAPHDRAPHDPGDRAPGDRRVVLLTGGKESGKTTACRHLVERARGLGLTCAGIISPPRLEGGAKVGIDVVDVRTGERRALAEVDGRPAALRAGPHRFDEAAVARARDLLDTACPCDILVVDEIGPLELEGGRGWANALEVLRGGEYRLAVAVVRPRLVEAVRAALDDLPGTGVVERSVETAGDPAGDLLGLIAVERPPEMPPPG